MGVKWVKRRILPGWGGNATRSFARGHPPQPWPLSAFAFRLSDLFTALHPLPLIACFRRFAAIEAPVTADGIL